MRVLLDTNVYVEFKRGSEAVVDRLRRSEQVLMSVIVIGELLYGFRRGSRTQRNTRELEEFLADPHVSLVPVSRTTADRFARIAKALRERGTPIPTNDIWIAAHTVETGAELLSFDRHFSAVDGLVWSVPA